MTVQSISDLNTPIGQIIKAAGSDGIVLESEGQGRYALLPLDETSMASGMPSGTSTSRRRMNGFTAKYGRLGEVNPVVTPY